MYRYKRLSKRTKANSMPNVRHTRSGWHLPGYNYCGPFTDINKPLEPTNKVDECCRTHDEDYSSSKTTATADSEFLDCIKRAGGHKLLSNIFRGKQYVDNLTGHASDSVFRRGIMQNGSRKRPGTTPGDIAKHRRIKQWYSEKSAGDGHGSTDNTNDETMDDDDIIEQCDMPGTNAAAPGSGGSGGGGVSGGPNNEGEIDRPFGQMSRRYTAYYKKSYISYVTNGLAGNNGNFGWKQNTPAANTGDARNYNIEWNEGWQIIPWGVVGASISRHEFNILNLKARRWRIKSYDVEMEGMIPFQEVIAGGGQKEAVTTFSNRPNMHVYVDDGHLLPTQKNWTAGDVQHNNFWAKAYGNFTDSKLQSPKFTFWNANSARWLQKNVNLAGSTQPDDIFSLYNTGKTSSLYPGMKFKKTHKCTGGWMGARGCNDYLYHSKNTPNTAEGKQLLSDAQTPYTLASADPGVEQFRNRDTTLDAGINQQLSTWQGEREKNIWTAAYWDTGLPPKQGGPPMILVKMEPYYQPDNNPMNIFAQVHLHYGMEVEIEEMDMIGNSIDPTDYAPLATAQINNENCDHVLGQACFVGPMDNMIDRMKPHGHNTFVWT